MAKNLVRSPATTITTAPPQLAQPPTVVVVGKTIIIITRIAPITSSARVIAITAISSQIRTRIRTHIRTKKDQTVRSPATIVTESK